MDMQGMSFESFPGNYDKLSKIHNSVYKKSGENFILPCASHDNFLF